MTTKMPGGFNAAAAKAHLESRWGLGPGRQNAVMLVALANQPVNRLAHTEVAKDFFDAAAMEYSSEAGISLTHTSSNQGQSQNTMVDSAALDEFASDQRKLQARQLEVLASHLGVDLRTSQKHLLGSPTALETIQDQLDLWVSEHGGAYGAGIIPAFDPLKSRSYDSYWNWIRDDILILYRNLTMRHPTSARELESQKRRVVNKITTRSLYFLKTLFSRCLLESSGDGFELTRNVMLDLVNDCIQGLKSKPTFVGSFTPCAPRTVVNARGIIQYSDIPREGENTPQQYCQEMSQKISGFEQRCKFDLASLMQQYEKVDDVHSDFNSVIRDSILPLSKFGQLTPPESNVAMDIDINTPNSPKFLPFLHIKQRKGNAWEYSSQKSRLYLDSLSITSRTGSTFADKTVLLTGSGKGSIGGMVLEGLLQGGATVIATTSRYSTQVTENYRTTYCTHGARGARLILLPFNQSSKNDIENLIEYVYNTEQGLGLDVDHILPFAAIAEGDNEIDNIDSKSELAHRMMLTNLLRLLGNVKTQKARRRYLTRPAQVILPLSPNHGDFGGDGLYSESKLALETLFNKWNSEQWSSFLTICGASIGWTRGTGLMTSNDIIAEGIEGIGVRTFSQGEMAFNIIGLMTQPITQLCETEPVMADLTGSLNSISDLKGVTTNLRHAIIENSEDRKLLAREEERESLIIEGEQRTSSDSSSQIEPRANIDFQFAPLPEYRSDIAPSRGSAREMAVNLENVVVVTGFAELGPLGNSRTRWDIESHGKLSLEGCVEMAWIMGLIKHHTGPLKSKGGPYSGWIDCKTEQPLTDKEVKTRFEQQILDQSGIRVVEPSMLEGRDNRLLQEIILQEDLAPFEASKAQALDFQKQHGDKADIIPVSEAKDEFKVVMKAGAILMVPREVPYDDLVAAQIPTGWDARRYGISEDTINQVDRVTLYTLICTAEALLSAGVVDPYEFYEYIHVAEVGNCIGSGLGGANALRSIFRDRTLDKSVQNDILQESFINTIGAWVNMLLLSSSGPIKTPVGACATALESVSVGHDIISTGQAQMCVVGGVDSFNEEIATEFGNMKATSDPGAEMAKGRSPKEMSRPNTSTRSGFVESEGCGIQILTTAKLALEMGLPIYGIVASATTATDKIGRSVPAPGQGILVNAREDLGSLAAPLRKALTTWGLTIDDLGVASMHGTSTRANDKNESDILCKQLRHLGRQEGNPVLAVTQKSITGHPKGAAGAWMMNGALQILNTGLVPGNPNLDNLDADFEHFDMLHYPGRSIRTEGVKAFSTTSFGFGQKSAQVVGVHPKYLFATLDETSYEEYKAKAFARQQKAYKEWHGRIISNSIFQAKSKPPYAPEHETQTLLSPGARATSSSHKPSYSIIPKPETSLESTSKDAEEKHLKNILNGLASPSNSSPNIRTGVDIEDVESISTSGTFIARNFTDKESKYCCAAGNPRASFAGRWSAKEAVFKTLGVAGKGAGAGMREIEILNDAHGAPFVKVCPREFSSGP